MVPIDFVVVAPQPWDYDVGSNARNIVLELSRQHRVLYVNPPLDWISAIKNRKDGRTKKYLDIIRQRESGLIKYSDNIWILSPDYLAASINWIGNNRLYNFLSNKNSTRFAAAVQKALVKLSFDRFIIINDNDMLRGLRMKELLRPLKYLYYIRDYLLAQPYFRKHGSTLEPAVMAKADAVIANSLFLKEYSEKFNKNSFYVGQGCETEMFDESLVKHIPQDIASIPSPIIGYVGFLTSLRLDISLLLAISKQHPDWNIVLAGPEDDDFKNSLLHQQKNVYFIGRKDPLELPAYVKQFDVCINPQAVNELTIGNYPRKIDEYLAMGKPTVATNTKAMEIFSQHTFLASSHEEFIDMISLAINDTNDSRREQRIAFARTHTWKNSVRDILAVINEH